MQNLKARTFRFAVNVATLVNGLPQTLVNKLYSSQLIRSSSSVEANYRAAQRAKSKADFINKLKISEEEADESIYFLELLLEFNTNHSNIIKALINEITEIL